MFRVSKEPLSLTSPEAVPCFLLLYFEAKEKFLLTKQIQILDQQITKVIFVQIIFYLEKPRIPLKTQGHNEVTMPPGIYSLC